MRGAGTTISQCPPFAVLPSAPGSSPPIFAVATGFAADAVEGAEAEAVAVSAAVAGADAAAEAVADAEADAEAADGIVGSGFGVSFVQVARKMRTR